MPRKTKVETEKTRSQILLQALRLFAAHGYAQTSLNDIAARLHMTKGAVYWHFSSKEAVLEEIISKALERFNWDLRQQMPNGPETFPLVAELMTKHCVEMVKSRNGIDFFRLMRTRPTWSAGLKARVQSQFTSFECLGPKAAYVTALESDRTAGRIRGDAPIEMIATAALGIFGGLAQMRVDDYLTTDLEATLRFSFTALWNSVAKEPMPLVLK